jgi:uncharacterized protein (DUF3820 family)
MTPENSEKKSYTARLIDKLEIYNTPISTINLIKEFAKDEYDAKQQRELESAGTMNFGKFKGKKLVDIAKLDKQYISWLAKNCKYLTASNQELLKTLV